MEPDSFPLQSSPVRSASATRAIEWPVSPVQLSKMQTLSSCNFCFCVIKEKYDRVILGTNPFDVMAEIASLSISLKMIGSKYGCRNCINKLKRRSTVSNQLEDLERELRKVENQNDSENKSQVTAPASEPQPTATIENDLIDCTTKKKKKVEVTVTAKCPSKEERKNLPENLASLGKTLVRGTYKQIANAVWKNEKIKKEIMQLMRKEVELQEHSKLFEKDRQRGHAGFFYGETLFRGRGQGTDATHRFVSCCYQQKRQSQNCNSSC